MDASNVASFVRNFSPIVALAGDITQSPYMVGFRRSAIMADGKQLEIVGVPAPDGAPLTEVRLTIGGELVANVRFAWSQSAGGWVLRNQVATLYRGGRAFSRVTVGFAPVAVTPTPVATRITRVALRLAAAVILPDVAYAGCGTGILRSSAEFVALVASAPAVTTGIGGVAWIAGWGVFTADLIDTAAACS